MQKQAGNPVAASRLEELQRIFSESPPTGAERFLPLWDGIRQAFSNAFNYHNRMDEASCLSLLSHIDGFIRASIGSALSVNLSDGNEDIRKLRDALIRISGGNGAAPEALLASRLLSAAILIEEYASECGIKDKTAQADEPRLYLHGISSMPHEDVVRQSLPYFNGDATRAGYEEKLAEAIDALVYADVPAALKNLVKKIESIWQYGAGQLEQLQSFIGGIAGNPNVMKTLEANAKEFADAIVRADTAINTLVAYIEKQKPAKPANRR